jgi:hypothetical protein
MWFYNSRLAYFIDMESVGKLDYSITPLLVFTGTW